MGKFKQFLFRHWQLLTITLGGLGLRLYNLTAISLWHDEAFSALLIKYSWGEMFYRIGLDVHPPMYYIFLRIWHYIFGYSLFSLRAMSVFFGAATILVGYLFIKELFNNRTAGLITALLIAVNPFQVQYVTEARMYTMGAFFAVLGAYVLVKALRLQKHVYENSLKVTWKQRKTFLTYYLLFIISCATMMLTHYYLLFSVAALGLYGIWYHMRHYGFTLKHYGWLVLSGILILVSFTPWLKWFLYQFKQVGAGYWIPPMDFWSIPRTLYEMMVKIAEPSKWLMAMLTLLILIATWKVIKKYTEPEKWLILALFFAPFGGAILFLIMAKLNGQSSSVYLIRYFIFASTFLVGIIALYLNSLLIKQVRNVIVTLIVIVNIFAIGYYWHGLNIGERKGMAAASTYLNANVTPDDELIVGSSFEFFNYKYYNRTAVRPLLYSGGQTDIKSMPHYAGTAILTNEDLLPDFNSINNKGGTAWVIWTNGFGGTQPSVPNNWVEVDEKGFAEVRPYVGTWVIITQYKIN